MAFIAFNGDGMAWDGSSWGWKNTRRFISVPAAVRSLQEAGEDIDSCYIMEDIFVSHDYCVPA